MEFSPVAQGENIRVLWMGRKPCFSAIMAPISAACLPLFSLPLVRPPPIPVILGFLMQPHKESFS